MAGKGAENISITSGRIGRARQILAAQPRRPDGRVEKGRATGQAFIVHQIQLACSTTLTGLFSMLEQHIALGVLVLEDLGKFLPQLPDEIDPYEEFNMQVMSGMLIQQEYRNFIDRMDD